MTRLANALVAAPVFLSCVAAALTGPPAQGPGVRLEIRLAQDKPAEGLKEATVEGTKRKVYLHKATVLAAQDVAGAQATADGAGNPAVEIRFSGEGRKKLAVLTAEHPGKSLAILLDGKVVAAPVVRGPITDGKALVTGNLTKEETERIARAFHGK